MKYLGPYIAERSITKFTTEVNVKVSIDTQGTDHSDQRQGERSVSDQEIREAVFGATEDIIQAALDGSISSGDKIHIKKGKDLHLICTWEMNVKGTPERVTVITAIRSDTYIPRGQKKTFKV